MQLPHLPPEAFRKADSSPDHLFYQQPRFVTHIDDAAIAAVTATYREMLPPGGTVLDLMSSWVSHLPPEIHYGEVIGHGMNEAELAANKRLSRWFVQDLNSEPTLPLTEAAFNAVCLCVSVQYLQQPVTVFQEVARVLRQGAPFVVSFSNRCFPTKAVAIWQALGDGAEQQRLIGAYMKAAGFQTVEDRTHQPVAGDPLWTVIGRR
ncbi:methyltransferase domain-containing protein [Roseomonas sp. KE2513]|uniref:class I SAM-dependent methyltransferase n=1 Tax=Roseomonas sp. KE2513 TaxID=2479202 RepID=UPI0018E03095|nr:methyltransferase domain-containing protein [Roseomonas sp. KE2513]MBI0539766.1 methyltransferase domain-containing protein [Roseomonas sp. KE2513]